MQIVHQALKVVCSCAGLRACPVDYGAAPTAAVVGNEAEARPGERWNLVIPNPAAARCCMHENHGNAAAATVLVPDAHTGKVRIPFRYRGRLRSLCPDEGQSPGNSTGCEYQHY